MSELRDSLRELQRRLDDDALQDSDSIEAFFRESYYRTADLFHNLVRPLKHGLERWANSDRHGARFLYEASGITVYVIAYLLLFALHIALGGIGGGPHLPGYDDVSHNSPQKRP